MPTIFGNEAPQIQFLDSFLRFPVIALSGPSHIGKMAFVHGHLQSISGDDDILLVASSVDDARAARGFVASRPSFGSHKFLLIDNAHLLTEPAQDAYLKIFEEADSFLRIMMVAEDLDVLTSALLSRVAMRYQWNTLTKDQMSAFVEADSMSHDDEASGLCDGRPGLYHVISSSPSLKSFASEVRKVLSNESDAVLAPTPEALKDLKDLDKRDAVVVIAQQAIRSCVLSDPKTRSKARSLSDFCSTLKRHPSVNPEIYWSRFVLGVYS